MLTTTPLPQANAYAMIGRRAAAAGIATKVGNHTFRATGITAYLKNARPGPRTMQVLSVSGTDSKAGVVGYQEGWDKGVAVIDGADVGEPHSFTR